MVTEMMKKNRKIRKLRNALLVMTLFILSAYSSKQTFGSVYDFASLDSISTCISPLVVLVDGLNNTSTIYTNGTSAKISINASATFLTYNYSLNIVNNNVSSWEVRLECFNYTNIDRTNATIILHDNFTSNQQITISGGNISQTGNYSGLASNTTCT